MNNQNFITGEILLRAIQSQTVTPSAKFERRDFVEPLIKFCLDNDYRAKIGIVYGLRSTGKTVGMLQAADELISQGHKVAYARFNYKTTGMRDANTEILKLVEEGVTHFFIDEASYLSGFLHESAEWADTFVPCNRIKIIVSGTDSFELWLAMGRALYHRYVRFSTNFCSYPEYKRVWAKSYDEYKVKGGVFLSEEVNAELEPLTQQHRESTSIYENFIKDAIVTNLMRTLEHVNEYGGVGKYYAEWLYAIDEQVIYKGVIAILKSTVESYIKKNFIKEARNKNIPKLGEIISKWSDADKSDIKERIANAMGIYQNSIKIDKPAGSIEALMQFLVKIGCLLEGETSTSDMIEGQKTFYFGHNALMNYAIEETKLGIEQLEGINSDDFKDSLQQAAEGSLNENIVYTHLTLACRGDEKIFRYRDADAREVDAVIISRKNKTVKLFEVKSKAKIDVSRIASNEARHLLDEAVIKSIGAEDFTITRVVVSKNNTGFAVSKDNVLLLVNIEDLLVHHKDLTSYLDRLMTDAEKAHDEHSSKSMLEKLHTHNENLKHEQPLIVKSKTKSKTAPEV